ncbi:aspartate--tRNA ligase [Striga asiatica]|uniref:Aspartate--tRNA ligase n=1 Tax=Striga asiatica TaxID=4170 RepID=A0A5A7PAW8_STRAF|nr:aspartate--tRNA ligase [Striga asiatica]
MEIHIYRCRSRTCLPIPQFGEHCSPSSIRVGPNLHRVRRRETVSNILYEGEDKVCEVYAGTIASKRCLTCCFRWRWTGTEPGSDDQKIVRTNKTRVDDVADDEDSGQLATLLAIEGAKCFLELTESKDA